nr:MAG TPA: hypothetical protein [Microviridae sp.]
MAYGIDIKSFPSIHNDIVDGIPESYVHYFKQYLYEIEDRRISQNTDVSVRPLDIFSETEIIQFKFNFKD